MARLFISQERLDAWSTEQRVSVTGDIMTLAEDGRSFRIRPAVRFLRVAGEAGDPQNLIETVQDERALEEMGADHYMDSVILGETAYDVQPGFVGEPLPRGPGAPGSTKPPAGGDGGA
jgi:hypothetical protein